MHYFFGDNFSWWNCNGLKIDTIVCLFRVLMVQRKMTEGPERLQQIFGLIKSGKMSLLRQYVETTNIKLNEGDKEGNSAVAIAVQFGSKDVVEYLVNDMRAEVNTKNNVSTYESQICMDKNTSCNSFDSHFLHLSHFSSLVVTRMGTHLVRASL